MARRVAVRQLPPKESFNNLVSLESRKGTKPEPDAKALMQLPKASLCAKLAYSHGCLMVFARFSWRFPGFTMLFSMFKWFLASFFCPPFIY